jgi:beta-galactosidase
MTRILINDNWKFQKPGEDEQVLSLPHTWNALDGQDGGNDYWRGEALYRRPIRVEFAPGERVYLECEAANSIATVLVDGVEVGAHKGGYSRFRFDLTDRIKSGVEADLTLKVDNGHYEDIYPLMADFTFFGGIYRDVYLIRSGDLRFSLDDWGSDGVYVRQAAVSRERAELEVEALLAFNGGSLPEGSFLLARLADDDGNSVADARIDLGGEPGSRKLTLALENPRLWDGPADPYLYQLDLILFSTEGIADSRRVPVGLRFFSFDAQKGLILNGNPLPLRGVSRHQDRQDKGWALSRADMEEDMALIREMGATSIRLAHYQHNRYFYELCDRAGIIAWAEIPYISMTSSEDTSGANAISQMTELIKQNFNHPSILIWGVQNEITIGGKEDNVESIVESLDKLTRDLDPGRVTAQAQVGHHPDDDSMNRITDLVGYNKYYGWYYGEIAEMGQWLDEFHRNYPDIPIGLTEYGCEAVVKYHNDDPKSGDYSEEYQTIFHQEMIKTWNARPWIWGTYVWNMFDFASDFRDEGGVKGMNNKGLVSFDRSLKKDSFYVYKAHWSRDPVLHIAGRRYVNRPKGKTDIRVISNLPEVELFVDGKSAGRESVKDRMAVFNGVKLGSGEHGIMVRGILPAGIGQNGVELPAETAQIFDAVTLVGVKRQDPAYASTGGSHGMAEVANWFGNDDSPAEELQFPEGYYSIRDRVKDLLKDPQAEAVLKEHMAAMFEHSAFAMIKGFSIERIAGLAPDQFSAGYLSKINQDLTKIPKAG